MKFNKDDIAAWTGSVTVHLLLIFLLYLGVMRTIVPDEDSGILVNFGDMYTAAGAVEPQHAAATPPKEIPPPPQPKPATSGEELMTQEEEETVAIPVSRKKKDDKPPVDEKARREREERERKRIEEEDNRRRREEELRKREEAISNRVSNAFGAASSQQSRQGDASPETANQGNPFGMSDAGANQSAGGFGTFNLNGRYIGQGGLPRPTDKGQEEGKIVINITVDPDGNVIFAEIGKGTNIDNALMRKSAVEAARRAKFNKIKDTDNQNGTITYIYKLK
jgi:TonB family protein